MPPISSSAEVEIDGAEDNEALGDVLEGKMHTSLGNDALERSLTDSKVGRKT